MPVLIRCPGCRKPIKVPESLAGKVVRCPACKKPMKVPAPKPREEENIFDFAATDEDPPQRSEELTPSMLAPPPLPAPQPPAPPALVSAIPAEPPAIPVRPVPVAPSKAALTIAERPLALRRYWLFALVLVPLLLALLVQSDDTWDRVLQTLESHPDVAARMGAEENMTKSRFLGMLPEGKIQGAHLSCASWLHWFYGVVAAVAFAGGLRALFPPGNANIRQVALIGLCSATFGVFFLLCLQWIAGLTSIPFNSA